MDLTFAANLATVIGVSIAAVGVGYAAWQLRLSAKVARGQFMLDLERMSTQHDEVHRHLRPGGWWEKPVEGPQTAEEWAMLDDYMGFFEHCEALLQQGCVDQPVFRRVFRYRIKNIVHNDCVRQAKLIEEKDGWLLFLSLMDRLDIPMPDR